MTDSLIAIVQETVAGTVTRLQGGRLRFDYDDDYRKKPGATPLSVSMPLQVRSHPDHVISPWLWGLLPDNEAVLARWARQFQASASSAFSMLSTPIGHDVAGAVRFTAPEDLDEVKGRPGTVTWLAEDDVAQRLRELREDSTSWLGRTFTGQFSLAGAQAKTALLLKDGRWGQPYGPIATSHILKPAVAGFDDHDLNEHLCLDAARRAGLVVARSRVAQFGDESAIVVERYDRQIVGDTVIRIHQEDLCQALSVMPSKKYQSQGGPGPKEIVNLIRQTMVSRSIEESIWRFVDALAWNWIIGGTDAHAKNYSLLLAGDEVRLAPLYDISSALPYGMHERKLRLAMKIGDDYHVYLYHDAWQALATDLNLDRDLVIERVGDLAARAPQAFADTTAALDVEKLDRPLSHRLVDLVANRSARCLKILGATRTSH